MLEIGSEKLASTSAPLVHSLRALILYLGEAQSLYAATSDGAAIGLVNLDRLDGAPRGPAILCRAIFSALRARAGRGPRRRPRRERADRGARDVGREGEGVAAAAERHAGVCGFRGAPGRRTIAAEPWRRWRCRRAAVLVQDCEKHGAALRANNWWYK